jgi:hypothetical protein
MPKDRTYPPCMIVAGDREFILNDSNENRVREKLYKLYTPDTIVQEWVDGHCVNEIAVKDLFNQK